MKKIIILIAYFGKWPEWINLYIETCKFNPSIDWLITTDNEIPKNNANNVKFLKMNIKEFSYLVSSKLKIKIDFTNNAYKICDFKLAYGKIFEGYITGYDYFGFGDIDVLYGNMRKFLTDDILIYDLLSFNRYHISGHLCLIKNSTEVKLIFQKINDWKSKMEDNAYNRIDEQQVDFFKSLPYSIYFNESYNTPLSPFIPWRNGKFMFPAVWYWKDGTLSNNIDTGSEFLYLHFMHYKDSPWGRYIGNSQWRDNKKIIHFNFESINKGFQVTENGFFIFNKSINYSQKFIIKNPVILILKKRILWCYYLLLKIKKYYGKKTCKRSVRRSFAQAK